MMAMSLPPRELAQDIERQLAVLVVARDFDDGLVEPARDIFPEVAAATKRIAQGLFENEHLAQTRAKWLSSRVPGIGDPHLQGRRVSE